MINGFAQTQGASISEKQGEGVLTQPPAWWSWETERLSFMPVCLQGVLVNFGNLCNHSLCPELM